jgi:hypothetical protein
MRNRSVRRSTQSAAWRVARELCSSVEPRRLLSSFTISGTAGNDAIYIRTVGSDYEWSVNGNAVSVPQANVTDFLIKGESGNDTFEIRDLLAGDNVTIRGGAGNDTLGVDDSASGNLDQINAQIRFEGDADTDHVILRDYNNGLNDSWILTNSTVDRDFWNGFLSYVGTETVRIEAGTGNNPFAINSTASGVTYDIFGNNGNDTFNVGVDDWDAQIVNNSSLNLFGEGGTDAVRINDSADLDGDKLYGLASSESGRFLADGVTRVGGRIMHASHESFRYTGGVNRQFVRVDWTSSAVSTKILTGNGDDEVWLGWNGGNLADVQGPVTVSGGGGTDRVVAYDDFQTDNATFTVDVDRLTHLGSAGVDWSTGVEQLEVNAGAGNNTFFFRALSSAQTVTVNGGDGNDTVKSTAGSAENLSDMLGDFTFNGGNGSDQLELDDYSPGFLMGESDGPESVSRTYSMTFARVRWSNPDRTSSGYYNDVEDIVLIGGILADTFNIDSLKPSTGYFVFGDLGDDSLRVAPTGKQLGAGFPSSASLSFIGNAGTDAVLIDDSETIWATPPRWYRVFETQFVTQAVGGGFFGLSYDSTESVTLRTSMSDDEITLTYDGLPRGRDSSSPAPSVWIQAGLGDDHIDYYNSLPATSVTLNGGGGRDVMDIIQDAIHAATDIVNDVTEDAASAIEDGVNIVRQAFENAQTTVTSAAGAGAVNVTVTELALGSNVNLSLNGARNDRVLLGSGVRGNVVVNDAGGTDTVAVDASATPTINGTDWAFAAGNAYEFLGIEYIALNLGTVVGPVALTVQSAASPLTITGTPGDDLFQLNTTVAPVFIDALGGNDTLEAGAGTQRLDQMVGEVTFNSGPGNDLVIVNNRSSLSTSAPTQIIASGRVSQGSGPFGGVNFSDDTERLRFLGHSGSKVVVLRSLLPTTSVDILTGGADTSVLIGDDAAGIYAGNVDGPVQITFEGVQQDLRVDDRGTPSSTIYGVEAAQITRSNGSTISWTTAPTVTLDRIEILGTNAQADTINLTGGNATVLYVLQGQGGDDTVNIASPTINSIVGSVLVDGGEGNDTVNIGAGDLDSYLGTNSITLSGGNGNDSLAFNDTIDGPNSNATTISASLINKNGRIVNHNTMEHLRFDAGGTGGFQFTIPSAIVGTTTINGTAQADTFSVATLPAGAALAINALSGNDSLTVNAISAGAGIAMSGGDGDDSVTLGNNLLTIQGTINFVGQLGTDSAILNDSAGSAGARYVFATGTAGRTDAIGTFIGGTLVSSALETLQIIGTTGADSFNNASPMTTTRVVLEGRDGNDAFTVLGGILQGMTIDGGNNDDQVSLLAGTQWTSPMTLSGGNGNDSLSVDDASLFSANSSYVITDTTLSSSVAPHRIDYNSFARVDLLGTSGANTYDHTTTLASTRWYYSGQAGADVFNIRRTFATGATNINGTATIVDQPGLDILNVTPITGNVAATILESGNDFQSITIDAGGYLGVMPSGGTNTLTTRSVSIATGGMWDLNDNAAVIDYTADTPFAQIEQYIRDGRLSKGVNSGIAVDPNARVGIAEMTDIFASSTGTFAGTYVDSTSVLLRYTRVGDSDLDRDVDFDDLLALAQSYGKTNQRWSTGDFSYDAIVNFEDLLLLAQQYGSSLPSSLRPATRRAASNRALDFDDELPK